MRKTPSHTFQPGAGPRQTQRLEHDQVLSGDDGALLDDRVTLAGP